MRNADKIIPLVFYTGVPCCNACDQKKKCTFLIKNHPVTEIVRRFFCRHHCLKYRPQYSVSVNVHNESFFLFFEKNRVENISHPWKINHEVSGSYGGFRDARHNDRVNNILCFSGPDAKENEHLMEGGSWN